MKRKLIDRVDGYEEMSNDDKWNLAIALLNAIPGAQTCLGNGRFGIIIHTGLMNGDNNEGLVKYCRKKQKHYK
jgi:hypothetical protein